MNIDSIFEIYNQKEKKALKRIDELKNYMQKANGKIMTEATLYKQDYTSILEKTKAHCDKNKIKFDGNMIYNNVSLKSA